MKILQVVTQMEYGGAQRVAYLLHQEMKKRGHDSELCFLYVKRSVYQHESGIRYLCDHQPNALDYIRIAKRLYTWIRRCQPDAIVAHTHYANILALFVGWLAHVQTRVAVQHNPVQTYPGISRPVDWLFGSLGIYTKQVAVSDAVIDSMRTYPESYRQTVERVYNGVTFAEETADLLGRTAVLSSSGPKIKKEPTETSINTFKKGTCFNCGSIEHWANKCPHPRKEKGKHPTRNIRASSDSPPIPDLDFH